MPRKKTRREDGRPRKEGWSDWSKAMVPFRYNGVKKRARGNLGYHKVKYDRPGECSPEKDYLR